MNVRKILLRILVPIVTIGIFFSIYIYKQLFSPYLNENLNHKFLYIPGGANLKTVEDSLLKIGIRMDIGIFEKVANWKKYTNNIKAGRYELKPNMSVWFLVSKLKSGEQSPVKLTFNNIRFTEKFAGIVGNKLEIDSLEIMNALNDEAILTTYGFSKETRNLLFLPNTYEFYWNISLEEFFEKMQNEYRKFWNKKRMDKAAALGLSETEVGILASIVQEETNKKDEMSRIAGVYLNRLRKGMLLQADPTARYAYGDFGVKRILNNYLSVDSPYNTYKYKGLPPGPICMPEPTTIDMVLDTEIHSYIYFCAKADGSGYHAFAKTNEEHINNARAYHRYLNSKGIR